MTETLVEADDDADSTGSEAAVVVLDPAAAKLAAADFRRELLAAIPALRGFARGLCVIDDTLVAAGSSPSTIAVHDLALARTRSAVTLSHDIRNAIHGLEVWPFSGA